MSQNSLLFANSRIKVLETRMISGDRLNRLLESKTPEEGVKCLYEVSYGDGLTVERAEDFEKIIEAEEKKLIKTLQEIVTDKSIIACFQLLYDCHNAKVLMKAKFQRQDYDKAMLYDFGSIDLDKLKEGISTENYIFLPPIIAEALSKCDLEAGKASSRFIETMLDKAFYEEIKRQLKSCKYPEIIEYFLQKADILNLSTAFRCKLYGYSVKDAESQLLPLGNLKTEQLLKIVELQEESITDVFHGTPYYALVKIITENGVAEFEKMSDNYLLSKFSMKRNDIFTVNPLMNYVLTKLNEIKNIRLILIAKFNKLQPEQIKSRLRDVL